jgi:hypothetical protein
MRCVASYFCLVAALSIRVGTVAAAPEPKREKTYYTGYAESLGKIYPYCRLLTVKMARQGNGSFEFIYQATDDQGRALESDSGSLALNAEELKAFAAICYQAWDLVYNRPETEAPGLGSVFNLETFRGRNAFYGSDAIGNSHLNIRWPSGWPDKRNYLNLPIEGVCVTLSMLSRTPEGNELIGDGEPFRAGIKTEPIATVFKEQQEIDLSTSIIKKFKAPNWLAWERWVVAESLDFRRLTKQERQYLAEVFARHPGPPESRVRMNSDTSFIVRLKLSDPQTLGDLRESFRVGYFWAADAADSCRRAANVKLLPIAAEFLFTDNAPKEVPMDDIVVDASPSIHAAAAIGGLLFACPEFPKVVRKSAETWQRSDWIGQDFLVACRKWWNENRQRIEKEQFDKVTPLASPKW